LSSWLTTLDSSSERAQAAKHFRICMTHGRWEGPASGDLPKSYLCLSLISAQTPRGCRRENRCLLFPDHALRLIILADRKGTDARKMGVGQCCLLRPGVERRLHLGEVALRFHLLRDIDAGIAQARHHVL